MSKIKIGEICFTNLFPIFYALRLGADCSDYEFVRGVPSELNRKIREGEIDISPSSSIEYLRNSEKYDLIANHSISSKGPVRSILLFSKRPIETLGGLTVLTSSQSETSAALLQIVMKKFYGVECTLKTSSDPIESSMIHGEACLLIGDDALLQSTRWPGLRIYDLGAIWYKNTGLPFTFALWIVRKESWQDKRQLLERFMADLDMAKAFALRSLANIAAKSPMKGFISEEALVLYWQGITYDFGEDQKKGFELFGRYSLELGLI